MTDWCFTGPKINWDYGVERAVWATNAEHNHLMWFAEMRKGDNVLIYISHIGVVGYCKIADKAVKDEPWWPDEIQSNMNLYPNVIYLNDFHLVADISDLSDLHNLALKSAEWRACGLTQRNITGGVNVIRNATVFARLVQALNNKTANSITRSYLAEDDTYGIREIKETVMAKVSRTNAVALPGITELELDDIDPDATPNKIDVIVQIWRRNRLIIADRKRKMGNKCEIVGCNYQPFEKSSGDYYSEAHHIIPIGRPGSENPNNITILCPNHHREIHYGKHREELAGSLINRTKPVAAL